ncbi:hypothetical protein HDU76_002138, partial [Blyttiomyces sp. JEL0837]
MVPYIISPPYRRVIDISAAIMLMCAINLIVATTALDSNASDVKTIVKLNGAFVGLAGVALIIGTVVDYLRNKPPQVELET